MKMGDLTETSQEEEIAAKDMLRETPDIVYAMKNAVPQGVDSVGILLLSIMLRGFSDVDPKEKGEKNGTALTKRYRSFLAGLSNGKKQSTVDKINRQRIHDQNIYEIHMPTQLIAEVREFLPNPAHLNLVVRSYWHILYAQETVTKIRRANRTVAIYFAYNIPGIRIGKLSRYVLLIKITEAEVNLATKNNGEFLYEYTLIWSSRCEVQLLAHRNSQQPDSGGPSQPHLPPQAPMNLPPIPPQHFSPQNNPVRICYLY